MSISDKLTTIAENEQKVYNAGHNNGYQSGYEIGFREGESNGLAAGYNNGWAEGNTSGLAEGKEAMNDDWWRAKTANYTRTSYAYGFVRMDFTYIGGFNPPETIYPQNATHMFNRVQGIKEITATQLDTRLCTNFSNMFDSIQNTETVNIEKIDTTGASAINSIFIECDGVRNVGKFILKKDGSQTFNEYAFNSAYGLTSITFEGVIGCNIVFTYCQNLTRDSILSIFNALKDYSGTETTHTIKLHSLAIRGLNDADKAIATDKGWTILNHNGQTV